MNYKTAIVDELGHIRFWCSDLKGSEVNEILEMFPEWRLQAIEVKGD